jgi:hypothetical protein
MNNLLGPVLAIVATALLLLLREFVLSVGKKNRNSSGARDHRPTVSGSDLQREEHLRADPIREFEEPGPDASSIEVDEFLAELRAKVQEQSPSSRTKNGSTNIGRAQSNRKEMTGDLW